MGQTALLAMGVLCAVAVGCASTPPPALVAAGAARANPTTTMADPTLDQGEALLKSGQLKPARELLVDWLKANPRAADRDRGIFLMARYYLAIDDPIDAFYQYDELLDNLPDSPLYYQALQNQYRIADVLLSGYTINLLWIPIDSYEDQAVEMLYRIQERSPGSPLAEQSLWRTAEYYFHSSQFDLASDVYTSYIHTYPRSELVPRATVRRAFSSLAQFRGSQFDATPLVDARSQFQDIIARYPTLAAEENIPDIIELIDRTMAQKMLATASFYVRTGKAGAAVYTYRSLIDNYPNSAEAQTARRDLRSMPAWALAQAPPPAAQPEDTSSPNLTVPEQ